MPYITSKRVAEQTALQESTSTLEVVVVNPASVIGPDDFAQSEFGTLCRRFWRGRIPFHFGGGNNFVDVRDVATGHLLAAERGRAGERYILGGVNRTYRDFFVDLARYSRRPVFRVGLPNAVAHVVAAINTRLTRPERRPYLTIPQARILALFFFCRSDKAARDFGYRPRPWAQTLADTHAFWHRARSA